MSKIIDGKALSMSIKEDIRDKVSAAVSAGLRRPCLAVLIVGDNPASRSYVKGKVSAAEFVGIDSPLIELPESISNEELLAEVRRLNEDPSVDGILVQLPLPGHIDADAVLDAIAVSKDVDGFNPANVAALWLGRPCFVPCTPRGVISLIESTGVEISGKTAVVVGRSNIVGKPVAKLLLDRNATVTIAHSRTKDLASVTRQADILVAAVGRPGMISADMIKPGAVVIDVGINRTADGRLAGDVDYDGASEVAGYITPVPGGVGPMTIAMLMENTFESYSHSMVAPGLEEMS